MAVCLLFSTTEVSYQCFNKACLLGYWNRVILPVFYLCIFSLPTNGNVVFYVTLIFKMLRLSVRNRKALISNRFSKGVTIKRILFLENRKGKNITLSQCNERSNPTTICSITFAFYLSSNRFCLFQVHQFELFYFTAKFGVNGSLDKLPLYVFNTFCFQSYFLLVP